MARAQLLRLSRLAPPHIAHSERRRRAFSAAVLATVAAAAAAAIELSWNRLHPEPYHTSALSGAEWVQELVEGHRDRMKDALALRPAIFRQLEQELVSLGGLRPRRYVDTQESLAIFLYQAVTNNSITHPVPIALHLRLLYAEINRSKLD